MRYNSPSIYLLRNPHGDESMVDIVRAAAVCDASLRVGTLVRCINMPELKVDLLSPDADIAAHFEKYRPDILIMPMEMLGGDFFAGLIHRLMNISQILPFLITVGREPDDSDLLQIGCFRRCLHIGMFGDPFRGAEEVRRFIAHNVIDYDFLSEKLRLSASLTLKAMHAEGGSGITYLLDEVTEVLEGGFVFWGSALALHKRVSELRGISPTAVDLAVRPIVDNAIAMMTQAEFSICFSEYISRGVIPSELEFVYAAAMLTSFSCRRLLMYLHYFPDSGITRTNINES